MSNDTISSRRASMTRAARRMTSARSPGSYAAQLACALAAAAQASFMSSRFACGIYTRTSLE
jgi:hypothetical protein